MDIPCLAGTGDPEIVGPVMAWGSIARGTRMAGTWTFYVDDYRFSALLKAPLSLLETGCAAAVEPNITLHDQTPRAEVIWATYRKRCVARAWQDAGISVRVDLNTPATMRDLCMLGVPKGWRSFATRGYASRLNELANELDFAREWGGEGTTVLVYGGGKPVQALCQGRPWARMIASHMDAFREAETKRADERFDAVARTLVSEALPLPLQATELELQWAQETKPETAP